MLIGALVVLNSRNYLVNDRIGNLSLSLCGQTSAFCIYAFVLWQNVIVRGRNSVTSAKSPFTVIHLQSAVIICSSDLLLPCYVLTHLNLLGFTFARSQMISSRRNKFLMGAVFALSPIIFFSDKMLPNGPRKKRLFAFQSSILNSHMLKQWPVFLSL